MTHEVKWPLPLAFSGRTFYVDSKYIYLYRVFCCC